MDISTANYDSSVLVSVSGRVDSYTAPKLNEVLHGIAGEKSFNIVLNLEKVNYVSSAGLRILIDIQKICKKEGKGETVLVSVPTRVYETLELAGFTPLFKFFENDTSAINYFEVSSK
jgi:anti-sigma B factor antagonist